MTNYERIKAMGVEKLAEFIHTISNCETNNCGMCPLYPARCYAQNGVEEWLESEAE